MVGDALRSKQRVRVLVPDVEVCLAGLILFSSPYHVCRLQEHEVDDLCGVVRRLCPNGTVEVPPFCHSDATYMVSVADLAGATGLRSPPDSGAMGGMWSIAVRRLWCSS